MPPPPRRPCAPSAESPSHYSLPPACPGPWGCLHVPLADSGSNAFLPRGTSAFPLQRDPSSHLLTYHSRPMFPPRAPGASTHRQKPCAPQASTTKAFTLHGSSCLLLGDRQIRFSSFPLAVPPAALTSRTSWTRREAPGSAALCVPGQQLHRFFLFTAWPFGQSLFVSSHPMTFLPCPSIEIFSKITPE